VLGVIDFYDSPRVRAAADSASVDHDFVFAADDGEGEKRLITIYRERDRERE
jgi:hypothetical protein